MHAAPGNPGIAAVATLHDVDPLDGPAVADLAASLGVDLVVVGPEAPLVAGVADAVRARGIAAFGPSAMAARLEGSKAFAKEVMAGGRRTDRARRVCSAPEEASAALDELGAPYVVKDDGLAAGKGVVVTDVPRGGAGPRAACCATAGGRDRGVPRRPRGLAVRASPTAPRSTRCSRPRTSSGSSTATQGPNTGGMGAYTPLPWAPAELVDEVLATVLQPTVDEMARRGTPFSGLLYAGLALTSRGVAGGGVQRPLRRPRDPAAAGAARLAAGRLLMAAATGSLAEVPPPALADGAAVGVVMASRGYPASSSLG